MSQDVARPEYRPARIAGIAAGSAFLALAMASESCAQVGGLPDLARPKEMPPIVSTPSKPAPKLTKPSGNNAVLALPGITAPGSTKPLATPPVESALDDLQLDAPLEMNGAPSNATPLPRVSTTPATSNGRASRPMVLESPNEEPLPIDGSPSRSKPSTKRPSTTPRIVPQPSSSTPKRSRFFGLFPAPAPSNGRTGNSNPSTVGRSTPVSPGRSVVEGAQTDVASESALKRRIEKQAREAVGDRARTIEVRIVGKVAVVQARGVKLFQKRNVRKSLESMPSLNGLKTSVEVLD
jgi:hypothetical protein